MNAIGEHGPLVYNHDVGRSVLLYYISLADFPLGITFSGAVHGVFDLAQVLSSGQKRAH